MRIHSKLFKISLGYTLLLIANASYAETIIIDPNTIIAKPTTYEKVTLDMSHGSFIIKHNASLTIRKSIINGTISPQNPLLIDVVHGKLALENNQVNIKTVDIPKHPLTQSLEYVVMLAKGKVSLDTNTFKIDNPFTAGLFITTSTIPTTGIRITHNHFERFHGVLYLITSNNSVIEDNTFRDNSYGHIVVMGDKHEINHNNIFFSGNYRLGNSIDVLDSSNVNIRYNSIYTPTCHAIYILNSNHMVIESNRISGGITYAMNVISYPEAMKDDDKYLLELIKNKPMKNSISNNITISNNYMSQNRYGLAVSDADTLSVQNNIFIQRFVDNTSRQFWTDNKILLQNVSNLAWTHNLYKEAYTQAIDGDNSKSAQFVPFPETGGVVLN